MNPDFDGKAQFVSKPEAAAEIFGFEGFQKQMQLHPRINRFQSNKQMSTPLFSSNGSSNYLAAKQRIENLA